LQLVRKANGASWAALFALGVAGLIPHATYAQAQQTPIPEAPSLAPQLDIAGSGVASLDFGLPRHVAIGGLGRTSGSQVNLSDSSLLLGASERLYRKAIGSFTLGGLALDAANSGRQGAAQVFLHQAFLDYQGLRTEAYVGRTDSPTGQIVQFPTLRGDDLITFTSILDPFSNGDNVEEHRYANVAAVSLNQNLTRFENFHAQHLIDSASGSADSTGLNSYGASYQYLNTPLLTAIQRVVSYGGGYEHRSVARFDGGKSDVLYAGGVVNLVPSTTNRVDLRVLANSTFGNSLRTLHSPVDSFRADSYTVTGAVRYLHSPFGTPGSQLALTAGYRGYNKVPNAGSFGLALTGVKRLGAGFDAVGQLQYQRRNAGLAPAYGGAREDRAIQVGFVFNFDATVNPQVGPRRSLLNLQHTYIPN
jgi:hypothetical protein